jgi:hypothetical protein
LPRDAEAHEVVALAAFVNKDYRTTATTSGPSAAPHMSFASLSTASTDSANVTVLAVGKSVGSDNAAPVPEPSTLFLALPAVLGLPGAKHARRRFGTQAS